MLETVSCCLILVLLPISRADNIPKVLKVSGKNMEQHNIAGYTSYGFYYSKLETIINENIQETYNFALQYNRTFPGVILSQTTPDKLLFLQFLHSFDRRNLELQCLFYRLAQELPIRKSINFKVWMEDNFNFPPDKVLEMVRFIATKNISLTSDYKEQIAYMAKSYKVSEIALAIGDNKVLQWLLHNGVNIQPVKENILENAWKTGQIDTVALLMEHSKINFLQISKNIVNQLFKNNETLLHLAVKRGFKNVVNYLVTDLGANIDSKDIFGRSPLFRAVESNNTDIVELLISLGADTSKEKLLSLAIINEQLEIIKVLIKFNVNGDFAESGGPNPLFLAVERNNVEILKALAFSVVGRENLNSTNDSGDTLMHIASSKGFIESVRILRLLHVTYDSKNNYGQTPLYKAVENGYLEIIKELITAGADINTQTDSKDTLMHLTAANGNIVIAELLLKNCIKIDVKNSIGQPPIYKAAQSGKIEMMKLLISEGADIYTMIDGEFMLHKAAREGNVNAVINLINSGFNRIDIVDLNDATPLYLAVEHGHYKVVELLLNRGANPNVRNKDLWTPLHKAAIAGDDNIVKLLLSYSANPNLEDSEGLTPLALAMGYKQAEVVITLIKYKFHNKVELVTVE
ncbi:putative ankyrin repeat protein RF_0381 [Halyomorpha halys]|uniref:putative ankyrin repeat protein RF_0381 n=1 Tax=Halyomorpha halys TaxID=286706 RepID=UPI0006D50AE6|nr:uncharacterized protein LOC106677372 [Halyomorpha halys]XP_014270744.1 uncharacterized protein LOC106677372 [Halyomorpha halys]XP_014270745.1 uncharacterized protein LOC106677372 [Halyomorpha halys]